MRYCTTFAMTKKECWPFERIILSGKRPPTEIMVLFEQLTTKGGCCPYLHMNLSFF